MESSRTRNSILDWLVAAIRVPFGDAPWPQRLFRIAMLLAVVLSIGVWLRSLLITGGGAVPERLVVAVAGAITLALVHGVARKWYDPDTALFAVALVAWNPLFLTAAEQPASDMPATMWMMLGLLLALRSSSGSAVASGLAAGALVITRPALVIAAAALLLITRRGDRPLRRLVLSAAGLAIAIPIGMAIHRAFAPVFAEISDPSVTMLSVDYVFTNLGIFARQSWNVTGVLWIAGLALGVMAARPEPRAIPPMILASVVAPYLFLPVDDWNAARCLLPGLVPLTIVAADGLMHVARWPRHRVATTVLAVALITATAVQSIYLLR